jgi:threonine-phosphate decarboxylase
MNSIENLVRENIKNLKPCVHGAEVIGAAQQAGLAPAEILDFSSSVNPMGPSQKALDAAKAAFGQIAAYPDSNSNELRDVLAAHYGIARGNLIVGNGSTELMYLFAETFLKPNETALMPAPTFGEYAGAVRKAGITPRFVKMDADLNIDAANFQKQMANAKIVFLCNPNNPTSMLIPTDTLRSIVEQAMAQDTLVFLDEDFLEFVEGEQNQTLISQIDRYPNLFLLRAFTKIYGVTGLRVGYGIADPQIINALLCAKIPWNINCIAQAAAVAALRDEEHLRVTRELIKAEKTWLQNELSKFNSFKFSEPAANFFFINIQTSGLTAAEIKNRLLKRGILIRDCTSFEGLNPYYIRIAVKTHTENQRLIEALHEAVKAV